MASTKFGLQSKLSGISAAMMMCRAWLDHGPEEAHR